MSTLGQLIDRAFREFLTPPDEQPTRFTLGATMASGAAAFTVDSDFLTPEEESLFGPGTIVEFERELVQVGAYDESLDTSQATSVKRAILGTSAAEHVSGTYGVISPEYARQAVFDALCDTIVGLFPTLYAVDETDLLSFSTTSFTEVPATVMEPMYVWARPVGAPSDGWIQFEDFEWRDHFPPSSTGKAIVATDLGGGSGYLVHKKEFARPTAESDNLITTTGLKQEWEQIALVGAVAHLIAGKDLSQRQQDFLVEQLKTQNYPVLTPTRVRESLLKYFEYLLDRAQKPLRSRTPASVVRHSVL